MKRFLYDTNCLIALHRTGHVHAAATRSDWLRRTRAGETQVQALPCLQELYAVLTGLPGRERVAPAVISSLIGRITAGQEVITLTAAEALAEMERLSALGIAGGQLYDGLIAACARKAGAHTIVTWNLRHFQFLTGSEITVVCPGPGDAPPS